MGNGLNCAPSSRSLFSRSWPVPQFSSPLPVDLQTDPERLRPYEVPERGASGHSAGLLQPSNEAELQQILQQASADQVALVISAGRTGLVEAQRPEGEVVLSLEKLKRPLQFQAAEFCHQFSEQGRPEQWADELSAAWQAAGSPALIAPTVTVQAGMAIDALNEVLAPLQLLFALEMGSTASASVGAAVANGSAGANAICYGTGAHLCEQAWGFWADGREAGPHLGPAWQRPAAEEVAIDSSRFADLDSLIGSQGVFGVISRVQLRLVPAPAVREALLLPAPDMPAAMDILDAAQQRFGADIEEFEFMSAAAIEQVAHHQGEEFRFPLAQRDAPYYVLLQVRSDQPDVDLASPLYELAADTLRLDDEQIGYAPLKALKHIRHSITESSNATMRHRGGGRLSFDTATPVVVFGEYLDELTEALADIDPELLLIAFGHAGVGGAHLHVLGSEAAPVKRHQAEIIATVFDVPQKFGGTWSAEHGVGPKWADEFLARSAPERVAETRAAKRRHDPAGILAPRSFGLLRN